VPAPGPDRPRAPSVHGTEVTELALLLRKDEHAWLLTSDCGHHEFDRVFYMTLKGREHEGPRYILKAGVGKLGGLELTHCAVDADGATLTWADGRRSQIPRTYFQYTWRA
jgi:hypothetical protein